jgi:Tol biopolymer transport system component
LASRNVTPMAGAEKYYVAAWSPDGKYLVAIAREPSRIVIYSAATKQWRELRRFDAPWGFYAWTPDSRFIYFDQTQTLPGMYRLSVPSGEWERISDIPWMGSVTDAFVSVTADGQPAVMNHTGVAQVYSLLWK